MTPTKAPPGEFQTDERVQLRLREPIHGYRIQRPEQRSARKAGVDFDGAGGRFMEGGRGNNSRSRSRIYSAEE